MKTGLVIYASSIRRLVEFYGRVFGFEVLERDEFYALLMAGSFELVLLETDVSKKSLSTDKAREGTPIKPVFFMDVPVEQVGERIKQNGGRLYPPKSWEFDGRQVCDGCDCEGNIFQLRLAKDA